MQDPCLSFAPSPKFTLLESVLASDDVLATFSDPTQVSKLFGHTVGGILKSERLCSIQQMALVLQWVVQQAAACQQHLHAHPLKLLPTLRASQSDQSSSHAAISTSLCCQLLCAMFLDCFDDSSRPGNGKWPHCNFEDILRSESSLLNNPASSTVHCIMQYFVSVHASLPGPRPLASDASFVVLHRSAISPNSSLRRADTWAKMEVPLCPVVVSRGSLDPRISEGHVVVDFANKVIGGGVLSGGNVQEEIMFSKHPEAIVTCLLCEQMYKTESIMIYGVRCFSECEGYGGTFTFLRGAQPPSPSAITTVLGYSVAATAVLAIDAKFAERLTPWQLRPVMFMRDTVKASVGFSSAAIARAAGFKHICSGAWGCGIFNGDRFVKFLAQWLAASAAGVTEFEYVAFGDDTHGDIVAEFVDEVQALQTASVTVASLFSSLMSVNPSHVSGYQKLNGSNTHSVLYERVIEALSAQPQAQQQHQRQHSGLPQVSSNPSSPVASLSGFAKRLFDFDDGAGKQADEVSAAPVGAAAVPDVVAADGSIFGTTLLRAHRVRGSNTLLCAVQGSVVFATTDAIVNAANQGCLGGGGVDGAVTDAGGPQLDAARRALPLLEAPGGRGYIRCHTGDAVTTIGGDLHARLCIHAVGPNFSFHRDDGDALLSNAYAAAMREGRQHNVTSVAFSLLSASIFRAEKPLKHVLRLGAAAVAQSVYEGCTHVLLCGYTQEECDELEAVLGELLAEGVLE